LALADQTDIQIQVEPHPDQKVRVFTDVQYSRDDYIGRGELGIVYGGTATLVDTSEQMQIVVKIPHSLIKADEAYQEYAILSAMRQKGVTALPEVSLGKSEDLPVIVMPYYRGQDLLLTQVRQHLVEGRFMEAERLAIQAGISFARAMQSLHTLETPLCCTDRKIKDFYALKNNRIVIIDWNVVRDFSPEFRLGEIRLFGYLWHELFMERKGEPPFEPFYDVRWRPVGTALEQGALSVGMRIMLARAVEFQPDRDGTNVDYFAALEKALTIWAQLIDPDADHISQKQVRDFLDAFPPRQIKPTADVEVQAVIADLNWRLMHASIDERDSALIEARQATSSGEPLQQEIAEAFERDPARAREIVEQHIADTESDRNWIKWAHLKRWERLIDIALHADTLNREGAIRAREKIDVERRAVLIGRVLHTRAAPELESAKQAIEEIRSLHAAFDTPELRQVEAEVKLREFVYTNQLSALVQQLKEIEVSLLSDGHYLRHPSGYQPNDLTLIEQIVQHYMLADLLAAVNSLSPEVENSEVYRLYYAALATADLQLEGRWLAAVLQPILNIVEFVADCRRYADPMPEQLLDLLSRAQNFHTQYAERGEYTPIETWKQIVVEALITPVRTVVKHLREASISPSLESVARVGSLFLSLNTYATLVTDKLSLLPKSDPDFRDVAQYRIYFNYSNSWLEALENFRISPRREGLETLLKLLDDPARGKIPMADLMGSDLIMRYRDDLETVIQQGLDSNLRSFLNQADEFKNAVAAKQNEVQGQVSGLQNELGQYSRSINDLIQRVRAELDLLQAQQTEVKARQALERFDVNLLDDFIRQQRQPIPALAEDLAALKDLENNQALRSLLNELRSEANLQGYSPLEILRDLRNRLRENTLSQIDAHGVEKFFASSTIIHIAQRNRILQSIVDLYWLMRINKLRDGSAEPLSVVLSNLTQRASETRRQLNDLYPLFAEGKNNRVRETLAHLTANPQSLTDELLRQLVYGWQERVAANEIARAQLNSLNTKTPLQANMDIGRRFDAVNNLLRDAQKILMDCPHSAYTPNLHENWKRIVQNILFEVQGLSDSVNQIRGGKQKEELSQRLTSITRNSNALMSEANRKVEQHRQIFAVRSMETVRS
jgi:hypothetical protein